MKVSPDDKISADGTVIESQPPVCPLCTSPSGPYVRPPTPGGEPRSRPLTTTCPFGPCGSPGFQYGGLLLLTNDGELAQALLRPESAIPRVYELKIRGRLPKEALARIEAVYLWMDAQLSLCSSKRCKLNPSMTGSNSPWSKVKTDISTASCRLWNVCNTAIEGCLSRSHAWYTPAW